ATLGGTEGLTRGDQPRELASDVGVGALSGAAFGGVVAGAGAAAEGVLGPLLDYARGARPFVGGTETTEGRYFGALRESRPAAAMGAAEEGPTHSMEGAMYATLPDVSQIAKVALAAGRE